MKKISSVFLLLIFFSPLNLISLQREKLLTPSGVIFELSYRAFLPGEVIVLAMKNHSTVKEVQVRFKGKKYPIEKGGINSKRMSFIGIDLNLKPGLYPLDIFIVTKAGEEETVRKQIPVLSKEFPLKKLWVDERFVIPPPEFHDRIRTEANILRFIYETSTPHWLGEGEFILPSSGKVLSNFGERRIFNNKPRSSHGGVDILSPFGSSVKASNSGKVVLGNNLYFAGKSVIIDHGLGVFTIYCHLSRIKAKRGDLVKKGEVIGEVGATGRVTGAHLHWGIKVVESRVNPFSLLSHVLE